MKKFLAAFALLLVAASAASAQTTITTNTGCPGAGCVSLPVGGQGTLGIQITGTFSGTVSFTASNGAPATGTFVALPVTPIAGGSTVTSATAPGIWIGSVAGLAYVNVAFTSYVSGSAVVQTVNTASGGGGSSGGTASSVTINDPSTPSQKAAVNASGQLSITCANCSGSGASAVDEAAFTLGSGSFAPAGGFFQTTATSNPLTTGQGGLVQMTAQRAFFINLRNAAGAEAGVAAVPLQVSLANTAANGTAVTVGQATGTNLHAVLDTTSTTAVTQATGTNLHAVLDTTSTTAVTQATGTNLHAVLDTTSTTAVTQATGTNLHAVLDTTSTTAVTQGTAANLNATVVGTGTFAVQAASTLGAETTKVIGTVRNLGNAGAITDFAGQNATAPANSWLIGGMFNTTPTTLTTGNASPLQLDNAGNLLVNIKAGAGSGGTALADQAAFTQTSTNLTPAGCAYIASYSSITTGHAGVLNCDASGRLNVVVANANANGSAASSASTPVVIATDQVAVAIKAGSASIASGAIASGAVASGAYAAGAMAAQSFAVGAIPPVSGVLQHGTPQTLTTTASGAIISAVASNYLYITSCQTMTTTTTGTIVDLTDGSAGTVIGFVPVPAAAATSVAGSVVVFPSPLKVTTNGNGLYGANESSTTTKISCQGWSSTVSY